jgi:hypothetical protein
VSDWYILSGHRVVGPVDLLEGALWMEHNDDARRVAFDDLPGGWTISTIFLCLDHGFHPGGPPMVFETMVFKPKYTRPAMELSEIRAFRDQFGELPPKLLRDEREIWSDDDDQERCSTWDQAEEQHARMRAKWLEKLKAEAVNGGN